MQGRQVPCSGDLCNRWCRAGVAWTRAICRRVSQPPWLQELRSPMRGKKPAIHRQFASLAKPSGLRGTKFRRFPPTTRIITVRGGASKCPGIFSSGAKNGQKALKRMMIGIYLGGFLPLSRHHCKMRGMSLFGAFFIAPACIPTGAPSDRSPRRNCGLEGPKTCRRPADSLVFVPGAIGAT
jgi:hypothetical protein